MHDDLYGFLQFTDPRKTPMPRKAVQRGDVVREEEIERMSLPALRTARAALRRVLARIDWRIARLETVAASDAAHRSPDALPTPQTGHNAPLSDRIASARQALASATRPDPATAARTREVRRRMQAS
jgi:hypothetical protein